jgi:hypothetical protein
MRCPTTEVLVWERMDDSRSGIKAVNRLCTVRSGFQSYDYLEEGKAVDRDF